MNKISKKFQLTVGMVAKKIQSGLTFEEAIKSLGITDKPTIEKLTEVFNNPNVKAKFI